jgi:hypothetical protein
VTTGSTTLTAKPDARVDNKAEIDKNPIPTTTKVTNVPEKIDATTSSAVKEEKKTSVIPKAPKEMEKNGNTPTAITNSTIAANEKKTGETATFSTGPKGDTGLEFGDEKLRRFFEEDCSEEEEEEEDEDCFSEN